MGEKIWNDGAKSPESRESDDRTDDGESTKFAEVDDDWDENDEISRRIRNAFRASRVRVPSDFFETRLKPTLDESSVWERFAQNAAVAVRRESPEVSRRKKRWIGAGIVASVALAVAFVVGLSGADADGDAELAEQIEAAVENAPDGGVTVESVAQNADATASDAVPRFSRIPLSREAEPRESDARRAARTASEFSASFAVASDELKRVSGEFSRFCSQRDINIEKFGGGAEFLLRDVAPKEWREIDRWFREKGSASTAATLGAGNGEKVAWRTTKAVESWAASSNAKARNVRVSLTKESDSE